MPVWVEEYVVKVLEDDKPVVDLIPETLYKDTTSPTEPTTVIDVKPDPPVTSATPFNGAPTTAPELLKYAYPEFPPDETTV
jgi:hypothetical protein